MYREDKTPYSLSGFTSETGLRAYSTRQLFAHFASIIWRSFCKSAL